MLVSAGLGVISRLTAGAGNGAAAGAEEDDDDGRARAELPVGADATDAAVRSGRVGACALAIECAASGRARTKKPAEPKNTVSRRRMRISFFCESCLRRA
jgi:hypothetical protein